MKKYLLFCLALVVFEKTYAQVTAKDCTAAVNICTNASFSVSPAGSGFIDFTTSSTVSNPLPGTPLMLPPSGSGCLYSGELNPTWMIINIQSPGTLEFSMGAGTGPGAQSGCYDWSMWVYNASTCSAINGNTLPPIRCCWNGACSGGTGLSSAANLPAGAFQHNFGSPINANCGDKFIMCFSNYSSVNTLVPLNFFGTAVVSCSPLSNTLSINSPSICSGAVATLSVPASPGTTYTWQPGGQTAPSITVSPASTTVYTLTATNACGVLTGTSVVIVSPPLNISFANTSGSCPSTLGSSTVTVTGGVGSPTYSWSPFGGTSTTASGLTTGIYSLTATDALGCKLTSTTSIFAPAPISFSLNSIGALTCINNSVAINAVNTSTLSNVTFTWMPGNITGSAISATAAGVYTVVGQDQTVSSCTDTQTIAITQNTAAPSVTVNPITQTLTCNGACKTFTAITTSTTNLNGQWYDQFGIPSGPVSSTPLIICINAPGIYYATYTNVINGCTKTESVSVTSNTAVPTISVTSVFGYVINCTRPCLPMSIQSSGTLAPTTYTWTNLTTTTSVSPINGGYTVCVPGSYEAAFMDGNLCKVTTTINVTIDTLRPSPLSMTSLASNSYTINCITPTLTATALTNPLYSSSSYSWTQPPNLIINSNTLSIGMVNIPGPSGSTVVYTVSAIGPNGCVGRAKVNFYKDTYVPPYIAVFTPSAITCANPSVALTPSSGTTTPISFTFTSPPPTQTATTAGALFGIPGTYTMSYQNVNNGCPGTATCTVPLNVTPPATVALANATINCGSPTTTITAGTTTASNTYSYNWSGPPLAGMSCPGGTLCNVNVVNAAGNYYVTILNTVNGCRSSNKITVVNDFLIAGFTPDPPTGYAPLNVNFGNTTSLGSTTTGTVTTTWSYGNGTSNTYTGTSASYSTTGPPNGNTTYQSAGTYTVYLVISQNTGTNTCVGTASAVVSVELPSQLDVPNVFTPNGDGVNDNFTLLTTNLTDITCKIFDRWGVKMYDVVAEKGNISWDGKNFSNKDVPAGTYFYILTAKGKDGKTAWVDDKGQEIKQTGTISLFR